MIVVQQEINHGWGGHSGLIKSLGIFELEDKDEFFPARFYTYRQENIVGVMKKGEDLYIIKYFMTNMEAVSIAKTLPAKELSMVVGNDREVLYDVSRRERVKFQDFREIFPRATDMHLLMMSDKKQTIGLFPGGDSLVGIMATCNYSSLYYKKPKDQTFTLEGKRFLYCWVCKKFGFPYNERLQISSINFPSVELSTPLITPPTENLNYLLKISSSLLKEDIEAGIVDGVVENVEQGTNLSLSEIISTGGIEEDYLEISHEVPVYIDIDAKEYQENIVGLSIRREVLEIIHRPNTFEIVFQELLDDLKWGIGRTIRVPLTR